MYYHNDRKLPLDRAFTLNDISFPANWLRLAGAEDKAAQGIEWRDDPALKFKNERFYYNSVDSDGAVVSTPKDLDMLKRGMIARTKAAAHSLLSGSDWMVVKAAEISDSPISGEWQSYRQSIRAESDRQEALVTAALDIDALEAVKQNWGESPDAKAERERREAEAEAAKLEREEND